jgi:hypothetical protein
MLSWLSIQSDRHENASIVMTGLTEWHDALAFWIQQRKLCTSCHRTFRTSSSLRFVSDSAAAQTH